VIHAIAKPGTIMDHVQRRLPEVYPLCDSADAISTYMPIHHVIPDFRVENSSYQRQHQQGRDSACQQHLTIAQPESEAKKKPNGIDTIQEPREYVRYKAPPINTIGRKASRRYFQASLLNTTAKASGIT